MNIKIIGISIIFSFLTISCGGGGGGSYASSASSSSDSTSSSASANLNVANACKKAWYTAMPTPTSHMCSTGTSPLSASAPRSSRRTRMPGTQRVGAPLAPRGKKARPEEHAAVAPLSSRFNVLST